MEDKAQINLVVNEGQKTRWKDYVDNQNQFSSLSDLIRTAVEKEIQNEETAGQVTSPGLAQDVEELKADISEIRSDLRWLRDQQQAEEDISDFAQEVFEELEEIDRASNPPADANKLKSSDGDDLSIVELRAKKDPQTAQVIADRLDGSPQEVHDAIDHLQDRHLPVIEDEVDGQTHYFKEAKNAR